MHNETYVIEIACDIDEGEAYLAWLRAHGHTARIGSTTGTFLNGFHTAHHGAARRVSEQLWNDYCGDWQWHEKPLTRACG